MSSFVKPVAQERCVFPTREGERPAPEAAAARQEVTALLITNRRRRWVVDASKNRVVIAPRDEAIGAQSTIWRARSPAALPDSPCGAPQAAAAASRALLNTPRRLTRCGGMWWCLMALACSCEAGEVRTNGQIAGWLEPKPAVEGGAAAGVAEGDASARSDAGLEVVAPAKVWTVGLPFDLQKGTEEAGFAVGTGLGMEAFGSNKAHDLVVGRLHYGRVLTDALSEGSWLRGHVEGRMELLAGGQYRPQEAYLLGLTPVVRYLLATGTRWRPFVDAGAGVSFTDLGRPDLSTDFQFNLQAGAGLEYCLRPNLALTLQYRFLHVSNAGLELPNYGVNASVFYLGLNHYF